MPYVGSGARDLRSGVEEVMMDPADSSEFSPPPRAHPIASSPMPVVPPRGLSGIFDEYDPSAILDTSQLAPNIVLLNVYDLGDSDAIGKINKVSTGNNNVLIGGVFHAGVEIFGTEWCYGFTDDGRSGVSALPPRTHPQHTYRTTVPLGATELSGPEVGALMERMCAEWTGDRYHLLHCNCCNFCNELTQELGVGRIPGWVDRAARTGSFLEKTSRNAREGARQTAQLARSMSIEVEQSVRSALPEVEQQVRSSVETVVDPDEAQRVAAETLETLREVVSAQSQVVRAHTQELAETIRENVTREKVQGLGEAVQVQSQVLGEAVQAHSQVIGETLQQHTQVLGDALQAHTQAADRVIEEKTRELFGDDFAEKAQVTVEKTQEHAKTFGKNLWRWGKDLQTAVLSLREDTPPRRRSNDLWDTALGGVMSAGAVPRQQVQSSASEPGAKKTGCHNGYPVVAAQQVQRSDSPEMIRADNVAREASPSSKSPLASTDAVHVAPQFIASVVAPEEIVPSSSLAQTTVADVAALAPQSSAADASKHVVCETSKEAEAEEEEQE